ncbi:MAG TPA: type II toxin-antitoxin system VapC family toxin [Gemmatimonadales bacterium]
MIVADANMLAYLVMPGERTAEAEAVLAKDPTWVAPPLWRSELRSVVHKYVLRGDITLVRAVALLGQADEVLGGREGDVDSQQVLDLASRSNCTTYDCEYVALAKVLGVPLVTTDRAVLKAFPKCAMTPIAFLGE